MLASSQGDVRFLEVTEDPEFRAELQTAFREDFQALGMLGWEVSKKTVHGQEPAVPVAQGERNTLPAVRSAL